MISPRASGQNQYASDMNRHAKQSEPICKRYCHASRQDEHANCNVHASGQNRCIMWLFHSRWKQIKPRPFLGIFCDNGYAHRNRLNALRQWDHSCTRSWSEPVTGVQRSGLSDLCTPVTGIQIEDISGWLLFKTWTFTVCMFILTHLHDNIPLAWRYRLHIGSDYLHDDTACILVLTTCMTILLAYWFWLLAWQYRLHIGSDRLHDDSYRLHVCFDRLHGELSLIFGTKNTP